MSCFSHAGRMPTVLFSNSRRGESFQRMVCVHPSRVGSIFPEGKMRTAAAVSFSTLFRLCSLHQTFEWPKSRCAIALVLFSAAAVALSACAPVYAKGAPLGTPDLNGTNGTHGTAGLKTGPLNH